MALLQTKKIDKLSIKELTEFISMLIIMYSYMLTQ